MLISNAGRFVRKEMSNEEEKEFCDRILDVNNDPNICPVHEDFSGCEIHQKGLVGYIGCKECIREKFKEDL